MKRLLVLASALALLASGASAANISLTGGITGLSPGSTGGLITVGVSSDDLAPPASENLTGWQVTLTIVPDGGAVGSLRFETISLASPNIFFGLNSNGLSATKSTVTTTDDRLFAFDYNNPFQGGAQVPGSGTGLIDITFTSTAGASGTFGLFASPGIGTSEWSDNSAGGPAARDFANLPAGGADVRLGNITIIPEPAGATLALLGLSLVCFRRRR